MLLHKTKQALSRRDSLCLKRYGVKDKTTGAIKMPTAWTSGKWGDARKRLIAYLQELIAINGRAQDCNRPTKHKYVWAVRQAI